MSNLIIRNTIIVGSTANKKIVKHRYQSDPDFAYLADELIKRQRAFTSSKNLRIDAYELIMASQKPPRRRDKPKYKGIPL